MVILSRKWRATGRRRSGRREVGALTQEEPSISIPLSLAITIILYAALSLDVTIDKLPLVDISIRKGQLPEPMLDSLGECTFIFFTICPFHDASTIGETLWIQGAIISLPGIDTLLLRLCAARHLCI